MFCLPTALGQMRSSFPARSGVRVNQCPLVTAHGCPQKGEWGSHGERLPVSWSFGVVEGIHASADLETLYVLHIIPPNPAAASPRDSTRLQKTLPKGFPTTRLKPRLVSGKERAQLFQGGDSTSSG